MCEDVAEHYRGPVTSQDTQYSHCITGHAHVGGAALQKTVPESGGQVDMVLVFLYVTVNTNFVFLF